MIRRIHERRASWSEQDATRFVERLQLVCGHEPYRQIAKKTASCPETVRRYMHGARPSVQFLARVCEAYGVSADWLLFGTCRHADDEE